MTLAGALGLFLAAALSGALNSVVGGGSFIAFPALLLYGVSPVVANATTAFALWPASVASLLAYRREMTQGRALLLALGAASLIGGGAGGLLLLRTPNTTFVRLVPWLLLFATVLFSTGGALTRRLRAGAGVRPPGGDGLPEGGASGAALVAAAGIQLLISIYGGYFGGGMGIMMLATWSVMDLGMTQIHAMNGLRTLLGTLINGVAVLAFLSAGAVAWRPGLVMVLSATAAGYLGAALARRIDPRWVKLFVTVVAWAMTAYFFARTYGPPLE